MKQFDITVSIRVTVPDDNSLGMNAEQWADKIANDYAKMALNYSHIGADKVIDILTMEVENV